MSFSALPRSLWLSVPQLTISAWLRSWLVSLAKDANVLGERAKAGWPQVLRTWAEQTENVDWRVDPRRHQIRERARALEGRCFGACWFTRHATLWRRARLRLRGR